MTLSGNLLFNKQINNKIYGNSQLGQLLDNRQYLIKWKKFLIRITQTLKSKQNIPFSIETKLSFPHTHFFRLVFFCYLSFISI